MRSRTEGMGQVRRPTSPRTTPPGSRRAILLRPPAVHRSCATIRRTVTCPTTPPNSRRTCKLRPINDRADPKALEVSGLSLATLRKTGLAPAAATSQFRDWLKGLGADGKPLVFVGFNAPFDWSFVNYYFHKFLGENPFGFTALDIKAFYMGRTGCAWADTRSSRIEAALKPERKPDHKALHDALYQAELFRLMRDQGH